jgi:hypothetical protein
MHILLSKIGLSLVAAFLSPYLAPPRKKNITKHLLPRRPCAQK